MPSHTQRKTGRKHNVIVEREEYQEPDVRLGPSQAAAGHTSLPSVFHMLILELFARLHTQFNRL